MTHFKCNFKMLIEFDWNVTFCSAMSTYRNREEFGPVTRNRSSSANEASKPILVTQRRQTHVGSKTLNFSPSNGGSSVTGKFPTNINRLKFFHFQIQADSNFSSRYGSYRNTQKTTDTQSSTKHKHTFQPTSFILCFLITTFIVRFLFF